MDLKKPDPDLTDKDLQSGQSTATDQPQPDSDQGNFDIPFATPVATPDGNKEEPKPTDVPLPDPTVLPENDNLPPLPESSPPKIEDETKDDQLEEEFDFNPAPAPETPTKDDNFWSSEKPTTDLTPPTETQPQTAPEVKTGPIWSSSEAKTDPIPTIETSTPTESPDLPLPEKQDDTESSPEASSETTNQNSTETEDSPPAVNDSPILPPDSPSDPEISSPEVPFRPKSSKKIIVGFAIVAGLFLIISFLILSALLKSRGSSNQKTDSLTYWGLWEEESVMAGIINDWEKQNPGIKVNYVKQDKQDYRARLQSAFARGDGPDIFRFHQSWLPMLTNELASVPNSVVGNLEMDKSYFPIVSQSLKTNDQFYGIPIMVETLALFYNKDILAAANKTTPKTWWGLRQTAKEITVRDTAGKIGTAGVALGTTNNVDHWSDILGLMILQNGGNPARPNNQVMEDTLTFYTIFNLNDRVWDETLPNSTLAFATDKLAFYFAPSWRVFNLMEANPNLNFGISGVPQLPKLQDTDWERAESGQAELTNINWSSFWVEGVSLKSKKQKEAWNFLSFVSSPENLQKLYTAQSQIRAFGELYPRVDLAQNLESDPLLKPFVVQAKTAQNWYLNSFTHDAGINDRIIKYYEDAVNAVNQGDQPSAVLETLESGVQQVLTQYGVN